MLAQPRLETVLRSRAVRILTIFIRAGLVKYPSAETEAGALLATAVPGVERDVLVVDNVLPPAHLEQAAGRTVIGGDNSAWKLSALDRAVAFLGPALHDYTLVHVVTSAFNTMYTGYLQRFSPALLQLIAGRAACLGHIDCYNEPIQVQRFRSQHWMRTGFFFIPPTELAALRTAVSVTDPGVFVDAGCDEPFRPDAPLSPSYKRYLVDWLTGEDVGQGVAWHSRLSLGPGGVEGFRQKALAIINEHLLAIRLRAIGCRLVDVTWLAGVVRRGEAIDFDTPWWRQLETREVDVVVPTRR